MQPHLLRDEGAPCERALAELEKATAVLDSFGAGLWGVASLSDRSGELTRLGRHVAQVAFDVIAPAALSCHHLWGELPDGDHRVIVEEVQLVLHVLAAGVRGALTDPAPVRDGEALHALHRLAQRHDEALRLRCERLAS